MTQRTWRAPPVSGFALRLAMPIELTRPTMAPHIHTPHPQKSHLCTERGVSQGLGFPRAVGAHPATGSGWIQPLSLAWRAASSHNPAVSCPASAALPDPLYGQQSPAPASGVRERPALAMGAQVFVSGLCGGPVGDPPGATIWANRTSPLGAGPTQPCKSTHPPDPVPAPQ